MPMKLCDSGEHYYNKEEHASCPTCSAEGEASPDSEQVKTKKKAVDVGTEQKTVRISGEPKPDNKTAGTTPIINTGSDKTVVFRKSRSSETVAADEKLPIAGWLVIIDGEGRGNDYGLVQGPNTVGRSNSNDVAIDYGDQTISTTAHVTVHYNNIDNEFMISPGNSRNIPRVNNKAFYQVQQLNDRDVIQIGSTELMFLSFCNGDFQWQF